MKKEIIVDGKESDWFEKATFILKEDSNKELPKDVFTYAENIVETYLKKNHIGSSSVSKTTSKETDVKELQQAAYMLQNKYSRLQEEKKKLNKQQKMISSFCTVSVTLCLISLAMLVISLI